MEKSYKKILVMILCGGKGERLYPLTKDRAKPSVPFISSYRIIDFSLSNALNSGLRKIALLTQYKSLSLEKHIRQGWSIFHPESNEYIISLPAQGRFSEHWYEGTADAVFQNIYSIQQENPDIILVLSGDHVYRADYRLLLNFFLEKKAEAVVMAHTCPIEEASRFGVISVDDNQLITGFSEKPKKPAALPWSPGLSLISMGVYMFETAVLVKALINDAKNPRSTHDFGHDVIPELIKRHKTYAYTYEDYWQDIGTIDAYWQANMDFLTTAAPFQLNDPDWPIRTYRPQYPSSFITNGNINNSILGSGCLIMGGRIENSILSSGVIVEDEAEIEDSIIFEGTVIKKGAKLQRTILDKQIVIPPKFSVGFDLEKDKSYFKISGGGIRVIPKAWRLE
ncbi:MAG TPA: glucose-1-phosphate adenylyltransferase [Candidatus Saccharicenans sp.]|nr:glucose-1-phosphate adenylyltransferase [Candidatus Saccharicenans sp.]HOL45896.1 glucose-1-phosphate adenylyltransferase [Candidatus Saccharicenans sp.]HOM94859.1 glucose-1-phosphate adenylyltransferase [Candidatus Saccharicenans sp.]HOT69163.1 glucose-1-phosphate adenylyltransferase [Candidatus Saccharicenans sp.]HPP24103.1 glucose-1-phosphate adenylyltransferase [Candidatus Saccharicenans sp.]